jgi:cyanophycinase
LSERSEQNGGNGGSGGNGAEKRRTRTRHDRTLIVIGGHEDKKGDKVILQELARRVDGGKLVVTGVASREPKAYFEQYERIFKELGVGDVAELDVPNRATAMQERYSRMLQGAAGIFFTGGDQLRITSQIGDTPIYRRLLDLYHTGAVIAGTSAGASVMCETMLVHGNGGASHHIGDLMMAPGLGLIQGVIIDQHFAERGRMGRLLGAVAQNPRILGIGIDEDTAIVIENERSFYVIGGGAVYVLDGDNVTYSNIAEEADDKVLSIHNIQLHVLSDGDRFDLRHRRPCERDASTSEGCPLPEGSDMLKGGELKR